MALTARQLNRSTLARQMLLARQPVEIDEAVKRVVALQAQEPASPYLALWNRVEQFDPNELDHLFAAQELVKASLMRITLHAVHRDDYPTFHEAMTRNLRASRLYDKRFTSTGMTADDADALLAKVLNHLDEPRDGAAMKEMLSEHVAGGEEWAWWALRTFAPLSHAPAGDVWSFGRRPSYWRAPDGARGTPVEALARLLERYLAGFGPASLRDFGQFALQRQTEIKEALPLADVVEIEGPAGPLYDVPGAPIAADDTASRPRLLGMWDSVLLAHADRSRVISDEYRKVVIRRNGDTLPTVLVDGYVAGVWRAVDGAVEVTAFEELSADAWDGIEDEAVRLQKLIADRDPNVYGRYGHWWDKAQLKPSRTFE